ncbi:twin-arginine translocation signal domain-containing protein [Mesorhizobium ventifaucium]|uniref:Twin-arginine translocation signal domain-containing protein n=1 Tax=Mesorhizobium ventifaucium TaxID=666020 RepID=A0ABM9DIU2_9HYPH|nr:twin-arginine translocation signal domain-containing protein [Mesorhizobium ventifaucium]CAH2395774.1 exported hypothetical protein [Mesorhizobium ventifaucium]
MQIIQSRRRFLAGLSAAGAVGLVGAATPASAEPPPETSRIRLSRPSASASHRNLSRRICCMPRVSRMWIMSRPSLAL